MGLMDWYASIDPVYDQQRTTNADAKRKRAQEDAMRDSSLNLLSNYMPGSTAAPEVQQANLLSAAVKRNQNPNQPRSMGGQLFGYDNVPTQALNDAAFPGAAASRAQAGAFPAQIDPDKRYKTGGDGTLWDIAPTGGGDPKRYGDPKPSGADTELVNVIDTRNPNAKPMGMTKAKAAALMAAAPDGRYAIGGAVSDSPKTQATRMTPELIKSWGLPEGTVAVLVNGKPEVVAKPGATDFLAEFGVTPDSTPDEIRENLGATNKGKNLVNQAQAVLEGRDSLQKMSGRAGGNDINQLRTVIYALDPSFNPQTGQARMQVRKEFDDVTNVNAPGSRIASASKLINHSIDLLENAADLANGKLNPSNWGDNLSTSQIAGKRQTALRGQQVATEGVGSEFEKVMGGGVAGVEARKSASQKLNVNDNITGTLGAVGSIANLMEGQITPLIDKHNQVFSKQEGLENFISKDSVQKLNLIKELIADSKAGKPITPMTIRKKLDQLKAGKSEGGSTTGAVKWGRDASGNPVRLQ